MKKMAGVAFAVPVISSFTLDAVAHANDGAENPNRLHPHTAGYAPNQYFTANFSGNQFFANQTFPNQYLPNQL